MQKKKEEEIIPAGQEDIKALTTKNAVVDGGTLVRPKEDVIIIATDAAKHLGAPGTEHVVHRVMAEKFVSQGVATLKEGE
jgi:hypothetical protein